MGERSYDVTFQEVSITQIATLLGREFQPDEPDGDGDYPLEVAARQLNFELVQLLIDAGANVNRVDSKGQAAVHSAIDVSKTNPAAALRIVTLLLDQGANIELRAYLDMTPFHRACRAESNEILELLVKRGCDVRAIADRSLAPVTGKDIAEIHGLSRAFVAKVGRLVGA